MSVKHLPLLIFLCALFCNASCKKNQPAPVPNPPGTTNGPTVESWMTTGDQSKLLQPQASLQFASANNGNAAIEIDPATTFQTMDGFGYTLTGASAMLINQMPANEKNNLLQELFGTSGNNVSYLRISIGASDLDTSVFTYDDMPAGQTDPNLNNFSLAKSDVHVIPVVKSILQINPSIKILASPWTAPSWMKTNNSSIGGSLSVNYYQVYANYFVKYIQAMQQKGITIDAITVQNEPMHGGNNPSMLMTAQEQANFIKNNLGPAFRNANLNTKIIIWDHNADNPNYPISILNDAQARQYVDGSAFHLYAGDISALNGVHNAFPDKNIYFTEQYTASTGSFSGDFVWHMQNLIIGAPRNWARNVLEWNLANDPAFAYHTPGGCTTCKGALTINGSAVQRNVSYYIIAQASKFVPAGSVRIKSSEAVGPLHNVAFKRPDGKIVAIVLNNQNSSAAFNLKYNNFYLPCSIPGNSATTFVW